MSSPIQQKSHDCAMAKVIENTYQEKPLDTNKRNTAERLAKENTLGIWGRTKSGALWATARTVGYVSTSAQEAVTDYRAADIAHSALAHDMKK